MTVSSRTLDLFVCPAFNLKPRRRLAVRMTQSDPSGQAPGASWTRLPDAPVVPDRRSASLPLTVVTFLLLAAGLLLMVWGSFEQLGTALLLFLGAMVTGIVALVVAVRDRRHAGETAAAATGAAIGGIGAVFVALVILVVMVVLAIMAAFMQLMMCLFTFGLAC